MPKYTILHDDEEWEIEAPSDIEAMANVLQSENYAIYNKDEKVLETLQDKIRNKTIIINL